MSKKLAIEQVALNEGVETTHELMELYIMQSVVPSVCSDGCRIEPDGHCEHGFSSILIELGIL